MDSRVIALKGEWSFGDHIGKIRTILGIRRNQYRMNPGMYSLGTPGQESPVLVTANYKLTVDVLRREAAGLDCWILVLDTKGVNVWCAAGKGTFGTDELINRIGETELQNYVSHRRLIIPQLGAPGVDSGKVKDETGFSVLFGPVEARDIKKYIENGFKASPEMRIKGFPPSERAVVGTTHLVQGLKWSLLIAAVFTVSDFFLMKMSVEMLPGTAYRNFGASLLALFGGSLLFSLLLPFIPGRAFSLKGLILGIVMIPLFFIVLTKGIAGADFLYESGKILVFLILIDYQALNLTGSSTYTSLSGVMKEMKYSIPAYIACGVAAVAMIATGGFFL